jgi:UDP-3-O-[3-hydroxymyristoyl] glucosamine N-acyltransferase
LTFSKHDAPDTSKKILLLLPQNCSNANNSNCSVIHVKNPRLAFAKAATQFFTQKPEAHISDSASIGLHVNLGNGVSIGHNCVIGDNVLIGENTVINHNTIIHDNTIIGSNCYIKSGTVIGEDGFGFDFEEDGTPVRIPHLGKVIIGDHVEIGAKNSIARGTLNDTVISDHVKTDDQVHIAHNCNIGPNTIITACAELSGSVTIGENCWLGPNCSIIQKVTIADNVTIGIGAVVVNDIEANKKVMGLDALQLKSLLKLKKRIAFGE